MTGARLPPTELKSRIRSSSDGTSASITPSSTQNASARLPEPTWLDEVRGEVGIRPA